MSPVLDRFCDFYRSFDQRPLSELATIYHADIEFQDPVHKVSGLADLQAYFERSMQQVTRCRFDIEQLSEIDGEAYVRWNMQLVHPQLNGGKPVTVPGVSHLRFAELIHHHRDYFDLGVMLYEQLPLLGRVIRAIKRRLA
jgi:hypothetical protein